MLAGYARNLSHFKASRPLLEGHYLEAWKEGEFDKCPAGDDKAWVRCTVAVARVVCRSF